MVFTPWSYANGNPDAGTAPKHSTYFDPDGFEYPSYLTFRDSLSAQILAAKTRICILSSEFSDRELGLMLFASSRRAVTTAVRVNPVTTDPVGRFARLLQEMRGLGVSIEENTLKSLKINQPTVLAIDQRAWSITAPLNEFFSEAVEVEASAWTSNEICRWAQTAASAKPATVR